MHTAPTYTFSLTGLYCCVSQSYFIISRAFLCLPFDKVLCPKLRYNLEMAFSPERKESTLPSPKPSKSKPSKYSKGKKSKAIRIKSTQTVKLLFSCILLGSVIYLISRLSIFSAHERGAGYILEHGYYSRERAAQSHLIYPRVEDYDILRSVGRENLNAFERDAEGNKYFIFSDDVLTEDRKLVPDDVQMVRNTYLNLGKLVYRKNSDWPETVVVTLIDFERYDLDTIIKIVQNRVDYAEKQGYGLYVRWIQELIPAMAEQDPSFNYDFYKPLAMRAAMHAFPRAKRFLFVDHEALIMNLGLSIEKHLLAPKALEAIAVRNVPLSPGANVNTYENVHPDRVGIVIPHDSNGELDMTVFMVTSDTYGKAYIEYMMDPIVRDAIWDDNFSSCASHVLMWHPVLFGRAVIVSQRAMSSAFDPNWNDDGSHDSYHYIKGDFVASFKGCHGRGDCGSLIRDMYEKVMK